MIKFPNQDSTENVIKVEGHEDIVNKIIAEIERLVQGEKEKTTKTIDVATDKHRKLIGREGSTRKEIETKHRVTVDIPRQRQGEPTPSEIKVMGMDADVDAAIAYILELTKDEDSVSIPVPRHLHHSLFDGGAYTRKLRSSHGIYIDFNGDVPSRPKQSRNPQKRPARLPLITDDDSEQQIQWEIETDDAPTDEGELFWILRGLQSNINAAKEEIEKDLARETGTVVTGYLTLPDASKYRYVVGAGGSQVNKIRADTGCKVTVPKESTEGEPIVLRGSREGVESAKDIILQLVSGPNQNGRGGGGGRNRGPRASPSPQPGENGQRRGGQRNGGN